MEWKPTKYKCIKCADIIYSKYPGHFASCTCGLNYVDQTRDYIRATCDLILLQEETTEVE